MSEITHPRQVVLISSRANVEIMGKEQTKDNVMTIAWHMQTSFKPELYAISIGKTRFSHKLIKKSRVFVVNFMSHKNEKEVLLCGRTAGEHVDKFKKANLTKLEAEKIDCPIVKEAIAYLECEVIDELDTGDHTVFVGKVVKSDLNKQDRRPFQLTGNDFTTTIK